MSRLLRAMPTRVGLLLVFSVTTLPSCNERFAFDVPSGGRAGGASGSGGSESSGSAGGGAGGVGGSAIMTSRCGALAECPSNLRCLAEQCVECEVDRDCTANDLLRCDPERRRCVRCLSSFDCSAGFSCDPRLNKCLQACADEAGCPEDAHGCDDLLNVCYECDEDRECEQSPLGPLCAVDGSGCVECREDTDCDQHCDPLTGRCVACRDGTDCASGYCDPTTGVCLTP